MSLQDLRESLIQENTIKLVQEISGLEETDENFAPCQKYAALAFRNHNFISINPNEVKKRIDGLFDRLNILNMEKCSTKINDIYKSIIKSPVCIEHYQTDIHWGIINFLLDLAHNPIPKLELYLKNPEEFELYLSDVSIESKSENKKLEDWKKILNRSEPAFVSNYNSDSDLSDWTDSEDEIYQSSLGTQSKSDPITDKSLEEKLKTCKIVSELTPPTNSSNTFLFNGTAAKKWIEEHIQYHWWNDKQYTCKVNSDFYQANFCQFWNTFKSEISLNMIKKENISTVSEHFLIREILWMFTVPTQCKFFRIENDKIMINISVSIPSVTKEGIQYCVQTFVEHMNYVYELEKFCSIIFNNKGSSHALSYQEYASTILDLLKPFKKFVTDTEKIVMNQPETGKILTIIDLVMEFKPYFMFLKRLHTIHSLCILDYKQNLPHICAAHMLAQLFKIICSSSNKEETNLCMVLYLKTIGVFLSIIDTWWFEGKLDDWRNEFLIEKLYLNDNLIEFQTRQFVKCKDTSFYVKPVISNIILNDKIIKILIDTLLNAGNTFTILHALDRVGELKIECERYEIASVNNNLYETFYENVMEELKQHENLIKMNDTELNNNNNSDSSNDGIYQTIDASNKNDYNREEFEKELLSIGDEVLLAAFQPSLDIADQQLKAKNSNEILENENKSFSLYERLNNLSSITLPYDQIITKILISILQSKFSVVNKFITRIYKEEYNILNHLQNLRRILLLDASDLMHEFYSSLFQQIENGENWSNPYHLTVQLNAIVCGRFSDLILNVQISTDKNINIDTTNVLTAIEYIRINYIVPSNLISIINESNLNLYNKLFQFLLKLKWCIWTLENLRFPDFYKKRRPYAALKMEDLIVRRLAVLRVWLMYSINSLHNYFIEQVIQTFGLKMDEQINLAECLEEIENIHKKHIDQIYLDCFQGEQQKNILNGIKELFNVVYATRNEWINSCKGYFDEQSNENMEKLERTYIKCHDYIARQLTIATYVKDNSNYESLCAAFNCSMPV